MKLSAVGLVVLAVAALGASGAAQAQTFKPAANASFTFDLDSADGAYSLWKAADLTGESAARMTLIVNRIGSSPNYLPAFTIALKSAGGASAVLQFKAQGGKLSAALQSYAGKDLKKEDAFQFAPAPGETFSVDVDWRPDGTCVFTVHSQAAQAKGGLEKRETKLDGAPTTLTAAAGTGELVATTFQLGTAGP